MPADNEDVVKGQIINKNKYGLVIKLNNKELGFVPNSQIDKRKKNDLSFNKEMSFKRIKNIKNNSQNILSLKFETTLGFSTLKKALPEWIEKIGDEND